MEKDKIYEEIMIDRQKLFDLNNKINSLGSEISFWKFLLIPLAFSILITAIARLVGVNSSKTVGIMIISFIIIMAINTFISKKKIAKEKDLLISQRMALQKEIVEKSKKLKDLD